MPTERSRVAQSSKYKTYTQPALMHFCLALLAVQPFSATLKATAKTSKQASETAIKIAVDCEIRLGIYLSTQLNIVESAFRCCI